MLGEVEGKASFYPYGRKSGQHEGGFQQTERLTGRGGYRRWTAAEKAQAVAETLAPGVGYPLIVGRGGDADSGSPLRETPWSDD